MGKCTNSWEISSHLFIHNSLFTHYNIQALSTLGFKCIKIIPSLGVSRLHMLSFKASVELHIFSITNVLIDLLDPFFIF